MKNIILSFILLSVYGFGGVYAQNPVSADQTLDNAYVTDLDLALKLSKETKQNIVLIFSTNWCNYCKILKKDLPDIKEFDNKIICILDSDVEKKLSRKFKAKSLPTSIMLDSDGNEISRISGYDKASYAKWLESKK